MSKTRNNEWRCRGAIKCIWIAVVMAGFLYADSLHASDDPNEPRKLLMFVKELYRSNLDSFHFCTCRFVHTKATTDSVASALKGLVRGPVHRDGLWIFKDGKIKYELKCRKPFDPTSTHPKGPGIMTLECDSMGYLNDGSNILIFSPEGAIAAVWSPQNSSDAPGIYFTPFTAGVMGSNGASAPSNMIADALQGVFQGEVHQSAHSGERANLLDVAIGRVGKPKTLRYEFNVQKGCLPVRWSDCYAGTTNRAYEAFVTDIKECSKGRWFPKRTVLVWDPDTKQESYHVDLIEVTQLDVDTPPSDAELVVRFPARVQISEPRNTDSVYWTRTEQIISVNDLAKVLGRCRARKKEAAEVLLMTNPVGGKPGGASRAKIMVGALLLFALLGTWFAYRELRRRHRERTAG